MPDPVVLPGSSARHRLAFLYPGQAQKEMFVNESLCRLDILLHPVVLGIAAAPPSDPQDGDCWLVAAAASGTWSGRTDQIAGYCAGGWIFCAPHPGMRLWDTGAARSLLFTDSWAAAVTPPAPVGGAVVDAEARAAVSALLAKLVETGVLSES